MKLKTFTLKATKGANVIYFALASQLQRDKLAKRYKRKGFKVSKTY